MMQTASSFANHRRRGSGGQEASVFAEATPDKTEDREDRGRRSDVRDQASPL